MAILHNPDSYIHNKYASAVQPKYNVTRHMCKRIVQMISPKKYTK